MTKEHKQAFVKKRDGVTATSYGLVVGLIAVFALVSVTTVGDQVNTLFVDVSDNLDSASGEGSASGQSAEAPAPSPPLPGQLLWASGDGSGMDVTGPSSTNSRCEVFTLTNTGELDVTGLGVSLNSTTYYNTGCSSSPADTCPTSGGTLTAGSSCTLSVRATATDNVPSMTASLRAIASGDGAGGDPADLVVALSGTSSGFPVPTDLTGLGLRFTSALQGSGGASQGYCQNACSPTFSSGVSHLSGGPSGVEFGAIVHHNGLNEVFISFTGDQRVSNISDLSLSCLRSGTSTPIVHSLSGSDAPVYTDSRDATYVWLNVSTPDFNVGETWDCYLVN
ncbi:MAG: hypothetical protein Alpg2KO_16210 [Alphaproteobacteria bacterium]